MDYSLKYSIENSKRSRWGNQSREEDASLLAKKDQQIKRLRSELQNEKRRADNAIRMLESMKGIKRMQETSSQNLHEEVSKRLAAEQQCKQLKQENEKLKTAIEAYLQQFKDHQTNILTLTEDDDLSSYS